MKIAFSALFTFVTLILYCDSKTSYTIGSLFHKDDANTDETLKCGTKMNNHRMEQTEFFHVRSKELPTEDSFNSSKITCALIEEDDGVATVFGPNSVSAAMLAGSICETHSIPHIQMSWMPDSLGPNSSTINFYPDGRTLAVGLGTVIRAMQWKNYIVLYEDEEGLVRLQETLKLQDVEKPNQLNRIILRQLGTPKENRALFKEIRNSSVSQIILDCHVDHVINILKKAKEFRLLDLLYSYFLTSLDAHTLDLTVLNTTVNITSWKIVDTTNAMLERKNEIDQEAKYVKCSGLNAPERKRTETALAIDALDIVMETIRQMKDVRSQPLECKNEEKWDLGSEIFNRIVQTQMETSLTGRLSFDEFGNRVNYDLDVVELNRNGTHRRIAIWRSNNPKSLEITISDTERTQEKMKSLSESKFTVSSRIGAPYLDYSNGTGNDAFKGFSKDLMDEIARRLNFTYEIWLAKDKKYGSFDPKTKQWNGLIKDLLDKTAHLAICDLTITHQRREVVDFSAPFMNLGISILYKKAKKAEARMFAFLDPFSSDVWIYTVTLYLAISILLYFISRMAPGDWENPHPCNQKPEELENIWDLKNCLWLTLGSIMTQGCDILPKGVSTRMASSMWWFFSLIMTSSYTANLAAFLTTVRMGESIDSAEDLAKQTKIKYGTVEGGATQAFFRESNFSTYQRMWQQMESAKPSVFEKSNEDGVKRVKNEKNSLYAFIMESSSIEYEVERNCDLKQVGSRLDNKGYGIAMPFNFPYRTEFNSEILRMQEDGTIDRLKDRWWKQLNPKNNCTDPNAYDTDSASAELALSNVGGVFLVLGVGTSLAFLFAIIEFLWNVHSVSVEEHITYWEAFKVEFKFAINIFQTKKRAKPVLSESSSSGSQNGDTKSLAHSVLQGATSFLNLSMFEKMGELKSNN